MIGNGYVPVDVSLSSPTNDSILVNSSLGSGI